MKVEAVEVMERRGRVMGTSFHLVAVGSSDEHLDRAAARLHQLERRWSRFLPTSEISAMNAAPDRFHLVSADTAHLVARGMQASELTTGACDPTVLDAVIANGYDRSFDQLPHDTRTERPHNTHPTPGCQRIEIDELPSGDHMIRLGRGVGFDPGAIGKGAAADIVVGELLACEAAGRAGAMVNIGGDVVCRGSAPTEHGWVVEVREPAVSPEPLALLAVAEGAVATSTTQKRLWLVEGERRHHVVDPATGKPTDGWVLATAIAAEGWMAEALATQLLVSGDLDAIDPTRAAAVVVDRDGSQRTTGMIREFAR